jgi:2-keto-4-pentenoate hydratase/2-oxohepta-3-ene-1,7-dioic acid hydratase in catechol pathway
MQLARVDSSTGSGFAVRRSSADSWRTFEEFGWKARNLAEAIAVVDGSGGIEDEGPPVVAGSPQLLSPVVEPPKILAIGLNYLDHIKETGATQPERPVVFAKYANAVTGPRSDILLDPSLTSELDYESELAVVIGRQSRRLTPENALASVFGYAVANDVSARDWQRRDAQFSRSKSYDTFCPIGPWITTADQVPDPQSLGIRSFVNGDKRQDSSTSQMLFDVTELLVYLSATMTLVPGDVILTGTPPGVGLGFKPPVFLQPGDVIRCEVDALGYIENRVVRDPESHTPDV